MKGYKTSRDYKRLKELLDQGYDVVCFCTYDFNENWKDKEGYHEMIVTDICRARRTRDNWYHIGARGLEYGTYWEDMNRYDSFEKMCENINIEFIEPTEL